MDRRKFLTGAAAVATVPLLPALPRATPAVATSEISIEEFVALAFQPNVFLPYQRELLRRLVELHALHPTQL